ncbi:conserved hypothetical protein [Neospora caninum Liverpool]|uniref:Uncharacterized protein n=1 Tax=Neospora caninum (strain Liverpool) TaxID=572307 RepID=F0VMZ3_NEOCL|nr:conserved hypothetical protein [Neospora caninum Liverpool]CBZ55089.1 conserved hypothetical protein [Neospora caninum Liverpool]CEL69814.1 TPA: hypothetical protein BN1204_055140 [Neospora caninum Liverpool]|eukprot:XP_003885117.1 conserved hypothetical protein [Neospora caninum Liverpool]
MSLCACPTSGRPHPSTLLRQFVDPRGRALSCFAVAETQGLVAVCTETYDPQTQLLLDRAYGRTPGETAGSVCSPGDTCGVLSFCSGGSQQAVSGETPRDSLGVPGRQGAFGRPPETDIPPREPDTFRSAQRVIHPAPRLEASSPGQVELDCQPSLAGRDQNGAIRSREKLLGEIQEVQHRHKRCFENPDRCGRCILFLDSRSLLPLREVVIGDMPDHRENNLICCCCCNRCAEGLCRMCSFPLPERTSRLAAQFPSPVPHISAERNAPVSEISQESSQFRKVEGTKTEQTDSPESDPSCDKHSTSSGACLEFDRDRSPSSFPLRQTERSITLHDRGAAKKRAEARLTGKGSVPDSFRCETLAFACRDRLICAVSSFAGVKVVQLGTLPVFAPHESAGCASTASGESGWRAPTSVAPSSDPAASCRNALPGNGHTAFPSPVSFDIEGRFPRLLTHLEFVPSFAPTAAHLDGFRLLDAGQLETREQQEALLRRLWTFDNWVGPLCGSAAAGERPAPGPTSPSREPSRFLGPCTFLDCLVHFRGQAPVRLVVDVTHGNRVLRCVSLLPRELLLLCCSPSREETASLETPAGSPEQRRENGGEKRTLTLPLCRLSPSLAPMPPSACVPASPLSAESPCSPRPSAFASPPADFAHSGSSSLPSPPAGGSPASSPSFSPSFSSALPPFPCPLPLRRMPAPHKRGQPSGDSPTCVADSDRLFDSNEGAPPSTPAHALSSHASGSPHAGKKADAEMGGKPSSLKSNGGSQASAGAVNALITARDFKEGTWKVKEGVRFPFAVFKKKEDFRLRLTAGVHVTQPSPALVTGATANENGVPLSSPPSSSSASSLFGGRLGRRGSINGCLTRGTDYSATDAFVPDKSFSHLEADFPVHAFRQLLLSQKPVGKAKTGETTEKLVRLLPLPTCPESVPTLADVERGVCAPPGASGENPKGGDQALPFFDSAAGEGRSAARVAESSSEEETSEEDDAEDTENDQEGELHPEEEWLVALALPHALVVVVDLHHRVVARHKFGLSKSTPFDRLAAQREGRFLLAWKERQCSVLELIDEPEASPRRALSAFASAPFYAPSGSLWLKFWRRRPRAPPESLAKNDQTEEKRADSLLSDGLASSSAHPSASAMPPPPLRLRLHLELPVGARFGHSGSKVERFVTFAFSQDPYLGWLVVVSRRGVIEWMPLTASDLLLLPSHRRFLALLTDSGAPHQEEAFVAPYVHFSRLSSNREHLSRALDFDRGSTDGSCFEDSSDSTDGSNRSDNEEHQSRLQFSPFTLPSRRRERRREDRQQRRQSAFSPFGRTDEQSAAGNEDPAAVRRGASACATGVSAHKRRKAFKKAFRRLRERQRKRLEAAGLDPRLHAHLEEKVFYQPLEALRKLQQAPAGCWASLDDIDKWSEEAEKEHAEGSGRARERQEPVDAEELRPGDMKPSEACPPSSPSDPSSFASFCVRYGGYDRVASANRCKILGHLYASYRRNLGPPHASVSLSGGLSCRRTAANAEAAAAAATVAYRQAMLLFNNDHCQPVYWLAGRFGPAGVDTTTPVKAVARAVAEAHARAAWPAAAKTESSSAAGDSASGDFPREAQVHAPSAACVSALPFESGPLGQAPGRSLSVGDAIGAWQMVNVSLECATAAMKGQFLEKVRNERGRETAETGRVFLGGKAAETPVAQNGKARRTADPDGSLQRAFQSTRVKRSAVTGEIEETVGDGNPPRKSSRAVEAEKENRRQGRALDEASQGSTAEDGSPKKVRQPTSFAARFPRLAGRLAKALEALDGQREHEAEATKPSGPLRGSQTLVHSRRSGSTRVHATAVEKQLGIRGDGALPAPEKDREGCRACETNGAGQAESASHTHHRKSHGDREGGDRPEALAETEQGQGTSRCFDASREKGEPDVFAPEDDQKALVQKLVLIRNTVAFDSFAPPLRHRRRELPSDFSPADVRTPRQTVGQVELCKKQGSSSRRGQDGSPERMPNHELTQEDVAREILRGEEPALVGGKKYPTIWQIPIFSPVE